MHILQRIRIPLFKLLTKDRDVCYFRHRTKLSRFSIAARLLSDSSSEGYESARGLGYDVPPEELFDVVVTGGGMVGSAMIAALGKNPLFAEKKILLLESAPAKEDFTLSENISNRVCALNPATVDLLTDIGAWTEICKMRLHAIKMMQVWDACSDALIQFDKNENNENLAYVVENDVIAEGIKRCIPQSTNVNIRYDVKVKKYSFSDAVDFVHPWVGIHLDGGETIHTRLLVGADGFRSLARNSAKIHTFNWEYDQAGVVANLHLSEPMENFVAWQRFLPTGPIAMLPVSDQQCNLIWSTSTDKAKALICLSPDSFVDAVNNAFWDDSQKDSIAVSVGLVFEKILDSLKEKNGSSKQLPPTIVGIDESSRAMFPLGLCHASQYVKSRLALVGDAAHRLHPLAGQGVNLGFSDVACLAEVLQKCIENGEDLGSLSSLFEYETARQRHVIPVMSTIDGLSRLYSTSFSPIVLLRSIGLMATNNSNYIKEQIMHYAMKGIK